jgi:hypothetical protein
MNFYSTITNTAPEKARLAIQKAMDVFLHDSLGIYEKQKIWHKTSCEVESGRIQQCLVLPPGGKFNPEDTAGLMFPPSEKEGLRYFTHGIILKQRNENNHFIVVNRTRLKVIIGIDEGRSTRVIDPFDVTSRNGTTLLHPLWYALHVLYLNLLIRHLPQQEILDTALSATVTTKNQNLLVKRKLKVLQPFMVKTGTQSFARPLSLGFYLTMAKHCELC